MPPKSPPPAHKDPREADAQLRVRLPVATKRWLNHQAVDHGLSQQDMAKLLIESAMLADKASARKISQR